MTLTDGIIKKSAAAIKLADGLITDPAIMSVDEAPYFYIPLEVDTCEQTGQAEVAESLIISTGKSANKKQYVADNVAPGPWQWELSGHIPGNPAVELTNLFTPIVYFNTQLIKIAFREGMRLRFKDIDCQFYNDVVIERLSIASEPDCKNKRPFQMTLREINVVTAEENTMSAEEVSAKVKTGNAGGAAADGGVTNSKAGGTDSTLADIVGVGKNP